MSSPSLHPFIELAPELAQRSQAQGHQTVFMGTPGYLFRRQFNWIDTLEAEQ